MRLFTVDKLKELTNKDLEIKDLYVTIAEQLAIFQLAVHNEICMSEDQYPGTRSLLQRTLNVITIKLLP